MDVRIRSIPFGRAANLPVAPAAPQGAFASFALPASQAGAATAAVPIGPAAAGIVGNLASPRDQVARRRARALLGGLASLQRELLGATADPAALQRLAGLLEGEDGEDPALAEAMRGAALRARIELLRRGISRGKEPEPRG